MATLDRLCQVSGGHMRNLIRLLDAACASKTRPFLRDTLEAVIRNERDSLMGLVSDHEWDLLLQAVSRQDVQGDEDYNILVRSLFLYEYRDAQAAGLTSTPCWPRPIATAAGWPSRVGHERASRLGTSDIVAHNRAALAELKRAITLRPNRFSLVLARCNYSRFAAADGRSFAGPTTPLVERSLHHPRLSHLLQA
jgi:hypothetical protein